MTSTNTTSARTFTNLALTVTDTITTTATIIDTTTTTTITLQITTTYGLDGRDHYSFTINYQNDFPFASSRTIDPVTSLICNRLQSPCNAPEEEFNRCWEAAAIVYQFQGQEAADVWNDLMT
ncbi:uncharacterized protein ACLA_044500 [Aspergillus clavatus NRRL 1]|uniref:Uncharacterized protein n=1 Tax=Aspergillus clavatus (strain ATCC 1007 / CBS 513.65 / DSM 816 / NCTC 3887 / NRRL 1 / QM 1276 / 107) TaxID=344612 RepID=A1C8U3_ASPCL|nr:uncharacterized protein ACLA_044500 [Aspergillus clavatus NRRL 1]EAW13730.1 hypothetical protein ACLA_044500 [Aspergillus clavatus NRRL 1]